MGGVTPARQPARGQRYILSAIYCFSHFTSEDPNEARWLSPCRCCFDAVGRSNRLHPASPNPKVRAITGFVRLDASAYQKQIADALVVLRKVKAEFESSGYEVETLRLTTQPLDELGAGMSEDQRSNFLRQLDEHRVTAKLLRDA